MSGFDCSGLACELMRAAGYVPYNFRTSAQGLADIVRLRGEVKPPQLGSLSFYGKSYTQIVHVGFCLDDITMIEAGGGNAETLTDAIASQYNAFVRMRPITFRKDFLFTAYPKYPSHVDEPKVL